MQKNQYRKRIAAARIAANSALKGKYRKPMVITLSVIILNIVFGFDPKFTIINLVWLLPFKNDE